MTTMDELTIGEVARRAGIQTSAIRYYESVGLLPSPKRVNGQRRYDLSVFKRLGFIQLARQAGFGIRELQALFGESTSWQTLANEKVAEMEAVIEQAQTIKIWLTDALHRGCVDDDCLIVDFDDASHLSVSCKNDTAVGRP
jgi:MerR family redox-sensitive transcriptional activator SoxR